MPANEAVRSSGEVEAVKIEAPEEEAPEDEALEVKANDVEANEVEREKATTIKHKCLDQCVRACLRHVLSLEVPRARPGVKIESHNNQPQVRRIDRRGVAHGRVRTWQSRIDRGDVARGRTGTSQSRIDCGDVAVGRDGAGSIVASSWPRWDVTKPDQSWRHRYGRVGA